MTRRSRSRRGASKARSASQGSWGRALQGWFGLLAGLAIGVFVTLLFWLGSEKEAVQQARKTAEAKQAVPENRPVFDFYTLLPESEVMLPAGDGLDGFARAESRAEKAPAPAQISGRYLLQAGSFRSVKDAERLKAQLLLWGLSPKIEKVRVANDEYWHRVQLGPFADRKSLANAQNILAEHKVDSLLLRMK